MRDRGMRRSLALRGLICACLISGVSLGVSGAFASGRHAGDLGDQIRKCKANLREAQQDLAYAKELQALVNRKTTVPPAARKFLGAELPSLIIVSGFGVIAGGIVDAQATVRLLLLKYALGEISARQLSKALVSLAVSAGKTKRAVAKLVIEAQREVDKLRDVCAAMIAKQKGTKPPPPPPSATTFSLQPGLTKVTNTHAPELKIDATGLSALEDHCCDGGGWKVEYSWKVPETITPGKAIQLTIGIKVLSVNPNQPVGFQITALAPDFAQAVQAHWPDTPSASKTFTVPIAADQKDSSDIAITIGFVSSGVVYHYRK
jgi:hypothetical protein